MKFTPTLQLSTLALFFSGLALFLYLLLWFRLLGFSENNDTATLLIAFCAGLALGSLFAQWRLQKGENGLHLFIASQIIAALGAALLLPILVSPEHIMALSPSQYIASWDGFITVFIIALIPASAMGMAFPLLITWLSHLQTKNASALIYGYTVFVLGALAATLLGGFYLMPSLGLVGTIYCAAGFNIVAALIAYIFTQKTTVKFSTPQGGTKKSPPPLAQSKINTPSHSTKQTIKLFIVLASISFIWMGTEIVWSKYISLYAGTTLYSFTAILATSLTGLVLGAGALFYWQTHRSLTQIHLFILLIALFVTLNMTRLLLSYAPHLYGDSTYLGELLNHWNSLWFALAIILPSIIFGAIIPLVFSLYCQRKAGISHNIFSAYAIHLLTAISGAIITALWLIPNLGSHNTLFVLTLTPIILALFFMPPLASLKKTFINYAVLITLGVGAFFLPPLSLQAMFKEHYYRYVNTDKPVIDLRLYETPAGVIGLTLYEPESLHIQKNGLTLSKVHIRHPYKGDINESLTALLPVLLQPNPTEALVLGFRAGTITRVLANSDLKGVVKLIEPEPKVLESMLVLNLLVNFTFLDDGRAEVEYKDFREALRHDNEQYSIITAQAPYAWNTNATRQYSQEFFNLVKSRLKPDGIFSYHLNLLRVDSTALRSILQTFYSVFPKGAVFGNLSMGGIVLLGSNQPLVLDLERTNTYFTEQNKAMETIRYGDLRRPKELPRYFLFSKETAQQMVGDTKIITDTNLFIESRIQALSKELPQDEADPYYLFNQYKYIQKPRDRL